MLVFLVGLPASGKSTLGKQLAHKIGYTFSDLDESIVEARQSSIEEIFAKEGEAAFRTYESQCLQAYTKNTNIIVSTGGGAPCFHNNMEWMNENGITVFLNPPLSELANRLNASNNSHRPMLRSFSKEQMLSFLENKFSERSSFYSQAKYTVDKPNPSAKDVLEKIEHEIK